MGGDFNIVFDCCWHLHFNPHHPCGWWLVADKSLTASGIISIHTTRVGGDRCQMPRYSLSYPFQSTPPVWVVTHLPPAFLFSFVISIHTTRVGGDTLSRVTFQDEALFQSTPPVWVVTASFLTTSNFFFISIHTTRVGGDRGLRISCVKSWRISIHTTRVGGD